MFSIQVFLADTGKIEGDVRYKLLEPKLIRVFLEPGDVNFVDAQSQQNDDKEKGDPDNVIGGNQLKG